MKFWLNNLESPRTLITEGCIKQPIDLKLYTIYYQSSFNKYEVKPYKWLRNIYLEKQLEYIKK